MDEVTTTGIEQVIKIVETGGVVALLLGIIFGFQRESWFPGRTVRRMLEEAAEREAEMKADRNYWRRTALDAISMASDGVRLAERRHEVFPRLPDEEQ